jgi:hypothetical protein
MCQYNSVPSKLRLGYRVYDTGYSGKPTSYYEGLGKPKNGKWVRKSTSRPFHLFQKTTDVKRWIRESYEKKEFLVIYKCQCKGNVLEGVWDDPRISTLTANQIKIVRRVKI